MEKDLLVEINSVSKVVKDNWKLRRVNLNIYRGEGIALIGQKNSGKEMLANLIENLAKPTGGTIEYYFDKAHIMESVGIQMPGKSWPMGFKTKDVVHLYKNIYNITDDTWIEQLIDLFDLQQIWKRDLLNIEPSWLQLLSLFLAVVHKPELIILEEFTSQITLDVRFKVINFLKKYKTDNNATLFIISPDEFAFNELCDRMCVLDRGRIIYDEYRENWAPEQNYESTISMLVEKIKKADVGKATNTVFANAVERYHEECEKAIAVIDEYAEPFRALGHKNIVKWNYKFIVELYNVKMFINYAGHELEKLIFDEWINRDLKIVKDVFVKLKRSVMELFEVIRHHKEYFSKPEYSPLVEGLTAYGLYVKNDLLPIITDHEFLYTNVAEMVRLSKQERKQLKLLKRKYILEELRLLRQETRILRRGKAKG